ncbi:T-box transcription factor TBX15-like [Macaca nemestrina]|uniref:T-box transcription factor TBX15-like n=1 Tax=Macaca nemestrina TaxID=9545 RepID=UPI0039B8E9BD
MHKYQPRVHVIRKDFSSDLSLTQPVPVGDGVKTFNFPETVFTTVTAYQNQQSISWAHWRYAQIARHHLPTALYNAVPLPEVSLSTW